jgi:hypothetical protein
MFGSFTQWWAWFSMSQCLFKKTECLHFLLSPLYSNDFCDYLSLNLLLLVTLYFEVSPKTLPSHAWFLYSMVSLVFKVPVPFQENWMPAFFAVPSLQQWFLWLSFIKLAASRYSVLWSLPQDPSFPCLVPLLNGEPGFQCPSAFSRKLNACIFAAPSLQQWLLWLFLKLAASCYLLYFWSLSPRPFPPMFGSFTLWWCLVFNVPVPF